MNPVVEPAELRWKIIHAKARLILILLTPLALIITFLVSVHLFLNSDTFREALEVRLEDHYDAQISVEKLSVGIDPRELDVFGLTMTSKVHGEVVAVERAHLTLSAAALMDGRVHIESADIVGGQVSLVWDWRGFSIDSLFDDGPKRVSSETAKEGFFSAERVSLSGVELSLEFEHSRWSFADVSVENFDMRLDTGPITMTVDAFSAESAEVVLPNVSSGEPGRTISLPMRDVRVESWRWRQDGFTVARVGLGVFGNRLEVRSGMMDFSALGQTPYQAMVRVAPTSEGVKEFLSAWGRRDISRKSGLDFESVAEIEFKLRGELRADTQSSVVKGGLSLKLRDLQVGLLRFEEAEVTAHLANRRIYLTDLGLRGYGGSISLGGERGPLPEELLALDAPPLLSKRGFFDLKGGNYSLPLKIVNIDLRSLLDGIAPATPRPPLAAIDGALDGQLRLSGRAFSVREGERGVELDPFHRMEVREALLRRPRAALEGAGGLVPARQVRVSGDLLFRDGLAQAEDEIVIAVGADRVALSGFEFDAAGMSSRVHVAVSDLGIYHRLHGVEGLEGEGSVDFFVGGPWSGLHISDGALSFREVRAGDLAFESVGCSFEMKGGLVKVSSALLEGRVGALSLDGWGRLYAAGNSRRGEAEVGLDFEAEGLDLKVLSQSALLGGGAGVNAAGKLDLRSGRIEGHLGALRVRFGLAAQHLEVSGQVFEGVEGSVDFDQGRGSFSLREGLARIGHGAGRVKVDVAVSARGEVSAAVSMKGVELEEVTALSELGVAGFVEHIDFRMDGAVDLSSRPGATMGATPTWFEWIATQPLDLSGGVAIKRLGWRGLSDLGDVYGALVTRESGHALSVVAAPRVGRFEAPPGEAADIEPALLNIEAHVPTASTEGGGPDMTATLRFNGLDIRRVLLAAGLFGPRGEVDGGAVVSLADVDVIKAGGQVHFEADRRTLDWEAYGTLEALEIAGFERRFRLRNNAPVEFGFRDAHLSIGALSMNGLTVSGDIDFSVVDGPRVDLFVKGLLDMRLFDLMPEVFTELRGAAFVDLSLKGPLSGPPAAAGRVWFRDEGKVSLRLRAFEGRAEIEGGTLWLCPPYALPGRGELAAACEGEGGQAVVIDGADPLVIKALEGVVRLEGRLPHGDGEGVARFELDGRGLRVGFARRAAMTLSPALTVEFVDLERPESWSVKGRVEIEDGRFIKNMPLLFDLSDSSPQVKLSAESMDPGSFGVPEWLTEIAFEVQIIARDGFRVTLDGELMALDAELLADLELRGTLKTPKIFGKVSLVEGGAFILPGARYLVRESSIDWYGPALSPNISIDAQGTIPNFCASFESASDYVEPVSSYEVKMRIRGAYGDDLDFGLTSVPHAPRADLFFMSILGCPQDGLGRGASAISGLTVPLQPLVARMEGELSKLLGHDLGSYGTSLVKTQILLQLIRLGLVGVDGNEGIMKAFKGRIPISDRASIEISDGVRLLFRKPIGD